MKSATREIARGADGRRPRMERRCTAFLLP
jgi:hypothetical protein